MATTRECAECGTPLPDDVPAGACPVCALRGALNIPAAGPEVVVTERSGDHIGRYKLLEKLGQGGCGIVYMAEQTEPIRRGVALKVIKLGMDTRQVVARFEAERQALALLDHPNIAKVLDAGATETGRPYFVMELVKGIRITDYCDRNSLPTSERLGLFVQVCQAIQHAHQKGIIHRDLKPSNILVTELQGVPVPKVIDFGIAKATGQQLLTDKTLFTALQQLIGTPAYMSPEQAGMGGADVDTRSDIYSLGVLLYELLTGHVPFEKEELAQAGFDGMRRLIQEKEPLKPSTRLSLLAAEDLTSVAKLQRTEPPKLLHLVRGDLDWIAMRALEKDRDRRYESADSLGADILRHLHHEPVLARPPSRVYRMGKLVRRNRLACVSAVAVFLALALGALVSTWQAVRARRAERGRSAVAGFLKETLTGVRPSVALGRDTRLMRDVLEKAAARVGKDLTRQPAVEAELRCTIGEVYLALGNYDRAEAMYRQALSLTRKSGDGPDQLAGVLDGLGSALCKQGLLVEAETLDRQALAIRQKLFGPEHPEVASSLSGLANVLWAKGDLAGAEALHREALAIRRKGLGQEHASTAASLDDLAGVLSAEEKFPEAEAMQREAVALNVKLLGQEHPDVAHSMNNLGDTLYAEGKLAEAEATNRVVLAMRRKLLGPEHPDVAFSLNNLGNVLLAEGNLAGAETLYREALAMRRKVLGNRHIAVAGSLNNLAGALIQQDKLAEAEPLQREALEIQKEALGPRHQDIAGSLANLGAVLYGQGKVAEAEPFFREALAMSGETMGKESLDVARTLGDLAAVLRAQGKLVEAESAARQSLAIRRKLLDGQHPDVAVSLAGVAAALFDQGKRAEAEALQREELSIWRASSAKQPAQPAALNGLADALARLSRSLLADDRFVDAEAPTRECLAIFEKQSPEDWQLFHARSLLGASLLGQHKFSDAEPLLLTGYEGLRSRAEKIPPEDKPRLREALQRLVQLYEACGKPAQAAEWRSGLEGLQ